MSRLPPLPDLDWPDSQNSAAPFARDHGDVYFSGEGLSEKRTVFLSGCGLPDAWSGREHFTVGELGFGTGLNLLALWDLWRRHRPSPTACLNYLSFEGALIRKDDAARIHAAWPELGELSQQLLASWPDRARGLQRIHLPDGLTLTLAIDDISAAIPQARAKCDAWFLDGFAPSKNPGMWSAETLNHVARLSAPNARAATYTVAGDVRRNLEAAGFSVAKMPGHGRKKERLEARLIAERPPIASVPKTVTIVGAGIAGACAAHAFLRRGCDVTVIDRGSSTGAGASGNPLALVMPRLDAADGPAARALVEAWLYARRFYPALGSDAVQQLDAKHLPRSEKEQLRFAKLIADPPLDETILQQLEHGIAHLNAIAVRPRMALPYLMHGATLRFGASIADIAELPADLVIVCAGIGLADIGVHAPALAGRLGQLESMPASGSPNAIADGGYAVEAFGQLVFGATFEAAHGEPQITDAARLQNLETLARLRPDITPADITSRAAIRATTQDRLPFAGAMPDNEKAPDGTPAPFSPHRLIGGLGSRGFLWAPLLAEFVASEAFGEPSPIEANVAECLNPGRFLARAARRGG
ncbi:MAG: tRNA (5-methylaminomethyl-2-thiouridine)(34)-methyltransferase MnmD [Hyphomonadaceae bacterium]|nr:tRNA (5-methylaminomethyl-2-thiouridine)(34)-methyltransferase MnmD [Hyphomonadaceae bacterium]